jgi:hypothetical protein
MIEPHGHSHESVAMTCARGRESGPPGVWSIALLDSRPEWYIAQPDFVFAFHTTKKSDRAC